MGLQEFAQMEKAGKNGKNSRVSSLESIAVHIDPLYTGGFFQCYMLDESIFHSRMSGLLSLIFYF